MKAFFKSSNAQRRTATKTALPESVLQITVDTEIVTALRSLLVRMCGQNLHYIRIAACDQGARNRAGVCVDRLMAPALLAAVLRTLPSAEFGALQYVTAPGRGALQ